MDGEECAEVYLCAQWVRGGKCFGDCVLLLADDGQPSPNGGSSYKLTFLKINKKGFPHFIQRLLLKS